jgi:hypothetical protein
MYVDCYSSGSALQTPTQHVGLVENGHQHHHYYLIKITHHDKADK